MYLMKKYCTVAPISIKAIAPIIIILLDFCRWAEFTTDCDPVAKSWGLVCL